MTMIAKILNCGNRSGDKLHVMVHGKELVTLDRGKSVDINCHETAVSLTLEGGNTGPDEYVGDPKVLVDLPEDD